MPTLIQIPFIHKHFAFLSQPYDILLPPVNSPLFTKLKEFLSSIIVEQITLSLTTKNLSSDFESRSILVSLQIPEIPALNLPELTPQEFIQSQEPFLWYLHTYQPSYLPLFFTTDDLS